MTVTDLKSARTKLKSNDPDVGLPGREDKLTDLENFLRERLKIRKTAAEKKARLESGQTHITDLHNNKTVFVCGVPGTGKTAVVMHVVEKLGKEVKRKNSQLAKFEHVYINAQHLASPQKVYSEILHKLTNINTTPEKAQNILDEIFLSEDPAKVLKALPKKKNVTYKTTNITKDARFIITIDELDLLYSEKRQQVFYSLFDWPTSHRSRLILVTIANAMDLPERHMRGRIGSRLGWNKIVFEPYKSEHLMTILRVKLGQDLLRKCFDEKAILVATKRIGKTTGDARRIIDTCCLAVDEAIKVRSSKVTPAIVDRVGFQNLDRMKSEYIRTCPPLELIILKGILNESAGQGEDNIYASGVYKQVSHMLASAEHHWLSSYVLGYEEFYELLNTLQAVGLIAMDDQKALLDRRLFIKDTSETFRDLIRLTELELK